VRVESPHPDVIVATSAIWQTTCTIIRGGEEAFVVDSPVLPYELGMLPALLEQAQFRFSGLLATHGDWDHLLGRLAFPGAALGVAESTAARLNAEPGAAQRALRAFDQEHYVVRPAPLALGDVQELPVPGRLDLGEHELELHPACGHTADGLAVLAPWAGVLLAGDYLSPVEIPLVEGGTIEDYLDTLERLQGLLAGAEYVVAGHGAVGGRERSLRLLEEDRAYLLALQRDGDGAALPPGRDTPAQRRAHQANAGRE
jgi:glyoxylase-like metal-dependent hydrolase (beta-lactamase superfamily II)